MIESSENLAKKQQERLLKDLQNRMNMFLTYDVQTH